MDPVTSPLIHKDSGRRARVDPGEPNPFLVWRNPACPDRSGGTMDPVTSPLIHKDSGRRARVDPGEPNSSRSAKGSRLPGSIWPDDGPRDLSPDPQGFRPSGPR